jgi:transposase-like protein
MARLDQLKNEQHQRQNRYFSEDLKRSKVKELENNLVTIAELSREYQVSRNSIYKWIYKYSANRKRQERQIIERMSDTRKIKELQEKVKELERIIGQKQIQIDFKEKMIEIAEEMYGVDIKKKLSSRLSSGSGKTGKSTTTDSTKSTGALR